MLAAVGSLLIAARQQAVWQLFSSSAENKTVRIGDAFRADYYDLSSFFLLLRSHTLICGLVCDHQSAAR
ncbi:unnamed protein product [Sphagnum jensenii]|uniref:Uncharacterized protein n=1 Tax=Sphagnum jensenii TaxID=128206 RepID=A0ABP1BHM5_9BRYO